MHVSVIIVRNFGINYGISIRYDNLKYIARKTPGVLSLSERNTYELRNTFKTGSGNPLLKTFEVNISQTKAGITRAYGAH